MTTHQSDGNTKFLKRFKYMKIPEKKYAIIMRGYIGSGKTTLAKKLAIKLRLNSLSTDYFLFSLFPYQDRSEAEVLLAFDNLMCALKNGIRTDRSFMIEGDALPVDNVDRLQVIIDTLEDNQYELIWMKIVCDDDEVKRRVKNRLHISSDEDVGRVKQGIDSTPKEGEIIIDTTPNQPEDTYAQALEALELE